MSQDFLVENENEVIRNIRPNEDFRDDSFEAIPFGVNVTLVVGLLKNPHSLQANVNPDRKYIQSVRFEKPDWTLETALDWLRENQRDFKAKVKKFDNVEIESIEMPEGGKSIQGVEIFAAGTWNGDTYSIADLDAMVQAFEKTSDTVRPFLKVGHDNEQNMLKASGLPAAGWIERVYRKGSKLMADFADIPDKIYELIKKKAYRKVSSEIYFGVEILDQKFSHMLGAVALLGAETPGVMNLSDILSQYGFKAKEAKVFASDENGVTIKSYEINIKEGEMPENKELIDAKAKVQALEEKLAKAEADKQEFAKSTDELEQIKKENETLKKDFNAKVEQLQKVEVEKEADKLEAEKLITKAGRKFALELLSPDKKEYSFKDGDKESKLSKFELVKEFAKTFAVKGSVNFDENSLPGESQPRQVEDKIETEIDKFIAEHSVDYATAYKSVAPRFKKELDEITNIKEEDE